MTGRPTSLRLPDALKERLQRAAARDRQSASAMAVRLIDEGVRMAEHPGIAFHDSLTYGRVACLAGGPDVAEVVDVVAGLEATGEARVAETARWLAIHASQVRTALDYYADHRGEVDAEIGTRHTEAETLRLRHQARQSLLG